MVYWSLRRRLVGGRSLICSSEFAVSPLFASTRDAGSESQRFSRRHEGLRLGRFPFSFPAKHYQIHHRELEGQAAKMRPSGIEKPLPPWIHIVPTIMGIVPGLL